MTKKVFPRLEVELAIRDALPPRRGVVMELNASGYSAKQIANEMGLSVATVNWHLDELRCQFGATNRIDLANQGWLQGLFKRKEFVRACAFLIAFFSATQTGYARLPRTASSSRTTTAMVRLSRQEGLVQG